MRVQVGVWAAAAGAALLGGCHGVDPTPAPTPAPVSTSVGAPPAATTAAAPSPAPGPEPTTKVWVDLAVGDCLADPPPTDPSVVTVLVVDCARPHAAEVFLRATVPVNEAVADVADPRCADGYPAYTGHAVGAGGDTISYLIDSIQDRTGAVPEPSTVICLLAPADGHPVSGTARR